MKKKILLFLVLVGIVKMPNEIIVKINTFLNNANNYILAKEGNLYYFADGKLEEVENLNIVADQENIYKLENNKLTKLKKEYFIGNSDLFAAYGCYTYSGNNNNNW